MQVTMQERARKQQERLPFRVAPADADDRLRELILYIADQCNNELIFGATKLNKTLYYADFISYARYGESITGAEYMKLPFGPAPVRFLPVRDEMLANGDIVIREKLFFNKMQKQIIALRAAKLEIFKPRDVALVDEIVYSLSGRTAKEVSDLSHGIAWRIPDEGHLIPYEAILLAEPKLRPQDIEEAHQLIRKYGWEDVQAS